MTISSLIEQPALRSRLLPLALPPEAETPVTGVRLCEDLDHLGRAATGALVLLTAAASRQAQAYRLEVGLRVAEQRGVAALVLSPSPGSLAPALTPLMPGETQRLPTTTARIAERTGVALLRTAPGEDLAELAVAVDLELRRDARTWIERAARVIDSVQPGDPDTTGESADALVEGVAQAVGLVMELREPTPGELFAPLLIDGRREGFLVTPRPSSDETAARVVLELAARVIAQQLSVTRHAQEAPIRSRADLLTELLLFEPQELGDLLHRARALELPVDGWHIVVLIDVEQAAATSDGLAVTETIGRIALQTARASGGLWHRAGAGNTLLLVAMHRFNPDGDTAASAAAVAERVVERVRAQLGEVRLRCGVSTVRSGPTGLRAAVAEARAAVAAARAAGRAGSIVSRFDPHGVRRTLLEWYASDSAQESVQSLLAPLDALGERRSAEAVRTLQTYLDHHCSLTRTADALHLHRNTVRYRMDRIFNVLGVDPDDPDVRLLLQLACRARTLG